MISFFEKNNLSFKSLNLENVKELWRLTYFLAEIIYIQPLPTHCSLNQNIIYVIHLPDNIISNRLIAFRLKKTCDIFSKKSQQAQQL
jgi:hypothetical protein